MRGQSICILLVGNGTWLHRSKLNSSLGAAFYVAEATWYDFGLILCFPAEEIYFTPLDTARFMCNGYCSDRVH